MNHRVSVVDDDISHSFYRDAHSAGVIACDIETSGLDWRRERIATCQIATTHEIEIVVIRGTSTPKYVADLIEDDRITKVFHHAPFDLRFMINQWNLWPASIACTKVASKILEPHLEEGEHSLIAVLQRHLGVTISKQEQVSDWLASELSAAQIRYAANDVAHLLPLIELMRDRIRDVHLLPELDASFRYLPTRARLDIRGSGDVFAY